MTVIDVDGLTEGTPLTISNSGMTDTVTPGASGSILAVAAAMKHGVRGIRMTCGTTAACICGVNLTPNVQVMERTPITLPNSPVNIDTPIHRIYGDDGTGTNTSRVIANIILRSDWQLYATGILGGQTGVVLAAGTLVAGQKIAFASYAHAGTTATDGTFRVRVYTDDTAAAAGYIGTEFVRSPGTSNGWNMGSGNLFTRLRWGFSSIQNAVRIMDIDYIQYLEGSSTWFDGIPAASTPTVTADVATPGVNSPDMYPAEGGTINLAAVESGTFISGLWSCTSQPPGVASPVINTPSAANTSVTNLFKGQYIFRRRLTWASTPAVDAFVTIYVHAAANQFVGIFSTTGAWGNIGGAANRRAAYTDSSLLTFGESGDNPDGTDIETIVFNPMVPGQINIFPVDESDSGVLTKVSFKLYQSDGLTLVDTIDDTSIGNGTWSDGAAKAFNSTALATLNTLELCRALVLKIVPLT